MKEALGRTGMRAQLIIAAGCLAYALVLQLHGDNVQPLMVTNSGPDAVLVGSTNRFWAIISGGLAPYNCEWYCDSSLILTSFGNATAHELYYIAPDDPKQATMCFAVTDSKPDNPQFDQTFRDFWQVRITLKRDDTEIPSAPPVIWAGQPVNLAAEVQPAQVPDNVMQWTLATRYLKAYDVSNNQGITREVTSEDLQNASITYYWIDGKESGVEKSAKFGLTIGNVTLEKTAKFQVGCPEPREPAQRGITRLYTTLLGRVHLQLGDHNGIPGVKIAPGLSGSYYYWIQTGACQGRCMSGIWGDQVFTSHGLDVIVQSYVFTDCPEVSGDYSTYYLSDEMNMANWLMFKFDSNSIHVPLQKVGWDWSAWASFEEEGWIIGSSSGTCSEPIAPVSEFPTWSQKMQRP